MSSNNTKSLDDFLYLDDSYSINEFFDDKTKVPYWFLIRNSVLRVLINKQLKSSITGVRKRTKYKILKMLFIYIVQVPLNILSVLMTFFSKRDVVLITRSESYSNPKRAIYTEYLIEKLSISPTRVISVETDESSAEAFRNEMIVFKSSSLKHILSIVCLLYSRVIKDKSVKEFMKALSSELSELKLDHQISEEEFIILEKELSVSLIRTRIMNLVYRIFICISRPKVIILEEGFYQHSVLLNKIASEKNIVTIEMQHGVVHPNHDAYNYSNDILQKKNLKQFFPDLFLTWGHFWEENIRIPTKTVSVGFPYRSSQLGNMRGRGAKELLVLGDGANTEKYISLCEEIIEKGMVDYQIVFRPHPMEKVLFESNSEELLRLTSVDVLVDLNRNLYHSLQKSSVVISEMSTCLFEAIGIVDRILVWRTDVSVFAFRELPFEDFSNLDELIFKLTQNVESNKNYEVETFWTESCNIKGVDGLLKEVLTFCQRK